MRDHKVYVQKSETGWLRDLLILAVVLAVPFLQFLGKLPLIDPDEGRYAEIPREMLERGDFITPTLNYVSYFEKPPLLYWLNAASFKLFGLSEAAARLPSALCGLLTVLATYIIARRLYDRKTALIASLILGTSAGFVLQSRIILTDMLLTFCLTAALGSFIVAARREGRRSRPLPWYMFYMFCALAVLAKGLIGIVFPGGIIFFYLLLSGRWKLLREMRLASGLLLFLAVAAPWFVAISLANPEFARFFFIHEHFERFTTTIHDRQQPIWFFLPVIVGTMLPWSFFIPGALGRAWRDRNHDEGGAGLYLVIWTALIFLFFSKSNSKLIPYILPIFPPLAILIACRITNLLEGKGRELKPAAIMLGMILAFLSIAAVAYPHLPEIAAMLKEFVPGLSDQLRQIASHAPSLSTAACVTIGALLLLQGAGTLSTAGRNPLRMMIVLGTCSFLLEIFIPHLIMTEIAQAESSRALAGAVSKIATPQTRIVTWGPMQGLNWYTGRRTATYYLFDELKFGSHQGNQSGWFFDTNEFLKAWSSNQQLLFVAPRDVFDSLQLLHPLPNPRIAGTSGRYILISNK